MEQLRLCVLLTYLFVYPFVSYYWTRGCIQSMRIYTYKDRIYNVCTSATPIINVGKDLLWGASYTGKYIGCINFEEEASW
jgi:hypothetical protein